MTGVDGIRSRLTVRPTATRYVQVHGYGYGYVDVRRGIRDP
jgi:hypothetical protein